MYVLIGVAGMIVLILLIAALLPKSFELTADTIINAKQDKVWAYVKSFVNQEHYSVRLKADPEVALEYTGVDGTVGAKQRRESKDPKVGVGEQEMMRIHEEDGTKSFEVEIRFTKPMVATHQAITILEDVGHGHTKVTNVFRGKTARPRNVLTRLFL